MRLSFSALVLFAAIAIATPLDPAASASAKLRAIENHRVRPASRVVFSERELNAWTARQVPHAVGQGVRNPRVEVGNGTATAYALVDFLKLRYAQGTETPWLVARLIEGEKPLKVVGRITSGAGKATVHLESVEIAGVGVSGGTLDVLIRTFFLTLYPDAKIDRPFELARGVDRLELKPGWVTVVMR